MAFFPSLAKQKLPTKTKQTKKGRLGDVRWPSDPTSPRTFQSPTPAPPKKNQKQPEKNKQKERLRDLRWAKHEYK